MNSGIVLTHVTKKYKNCIAVNGVDLVIDKPMIYGLIGKNGAGKTTLLKLIAGLARPTGGEIATHSDLGVGTLIENPGIFPHLSAIDNLLVKIKMTGKGDKKLAEKLLFDVGLSPDLKKEVGSFSLGMKQRLGIALSLVGDPDILLLDEPINGLDPEGIIFVRDLLTDLERQNKIIIVSSHMLEELSKIAGRYGFLDNGRLVKEFDREALNSINTSSFVLTVDRYDKAREILYSVGLNYTLNAEGILLREEEDRASFALKAILDGGVIVKEFKRAVTPLEDIFLSGREER